jgi:hypothetical protein
MLQPDITAACVFTFATEAAGADARAFPALTALVARVEALPEFRATYTPFFTPSSKP